MSHTQWAVWVFSSIVFFLFGIYTGHQKSKTERIVSAEHLNLVYENCANFNGICEGCVTACQAGVENTLRVLTLR